MNTLPTTLLCTVGTSLFFPNLNNLNPETQYKNEPKDTDLLGQADKEALSRYRLWTEQERLKKILKNIRTFYIQKEFSHLANQLVLLPPELRICGAEINSIEAMIRKKFLSEERKHRNRLMLLVSDTPDGEYIGTILKTYFVHKKCEIGFNECEYLTVEGLQDEKPLFFQTKGLPNLVHHLGEQLRKWGNIAINATGGYKAQIALAVAFGQATRCPVFYKHERFDQIIRFPKIPFTIDLSMVENHLKFWADMADNTIKENELNQMIPHDSDFKESFYPMLDSVEENGILYFSLSALGMVYWEAYLSSNPDISIEPQKIIDKDRRGCNFPQHHYPINFKEYVQKVYDAFPEFISECHSLDHDKQSAIKNRFNIKEKRIIAEYVDRNNFGARFGVMTSAVNTLERDWIVKKLSEWLENNM
ncbi:MAG: hypothetical protein BWK80_19020 [Desulfobacteraceae bacterium IS3]|nr:MAG: hypothetical protein BWK80_19020 [Desulfobacteraceae bacterium IS3]